MSFAIRRLQGLTDSAVDATVECMNRGTQDDKLQLAWAGWDNALLPTSNRMVLRVASRGGEIYIAEKSDVSGGTSSVCGIVIWYPPERSAVLTPDVIGECMQELVSRLSPDIMQWYKEEFLGGLGQLYTSSFGDDANHYQQWHLQMIFADDDGERPEIVEALLQPLFASVRSVVSSPLLLTPYFRDKALFAWRWRKRKM
ncbi:hypothetical protein DL96DRAFT_542115 [Flagelloscypha sp. PMI_526]|nr:hypothetical protein DL96DRAFT_542115 [Flagelloscypha sp. PMI_526]